MTVALDPSLICHAPTFVQAPKADSKPAEAVAARSTVVSSAREPQDAEALKTLQVGCKTLQVM
jgi:hypothetical protein